MLVGRLHVVDVFDALRPCTHAISHAGLPWCGDIWEVASPIRRVTLVRLNGYARNDWHLGRL